MALQVDTQGGGQGRLEAAFSSMGPRVWRAVYLYSANREIADDAVAEAFAQGLRAQDRIEKLDAWIWAAAFRIAAAELKHRGSHTEGHAVEEILTPPPTETLLDLMDALGRISDLQRRALVLRYYMGYSNVEIARLLGSTPSSIGVQLFRATRRLRRELMEEEER